MKRGAKKVTFSSRGFAARFRARGYARARLIVLQFSPALQREPARRLDSSQVADDLGLAKTSLLLSEYIKHGKQYFFGISKHREEIRRAAEYF